MRACEDTFPEPYESYEVVTGLKKASDFNHTVPNHTYYH